MPEANPLKNVIEKLSSETKAQDEAIIELKDAIKNIDEEIASAVGDKIKDTFGGVESILYSQFPKLGSIFSGLKGVYSSIKKFSDWQAGIGEKRSELKQLKIQLEELEQSKQTNEKLDRLNNNIQAQSTLLRNNESTRLKERRIDLTAAAENAEEASKIHGEAAGAIGTTAGPAEPQGLLRTIFDKVLDYYGFNDLGKLLTGTKIGSWVGNIGKSLSPMRAYRLSRANMQRSAQGRTGPFPQFGRNAAENIPQVTTTSPILDQYGRPFPSNNVPAPTTAPPASVARPNFWSSGMGQRLGSLKSAKGFFKAAGGKFALVDAALAGMRLWDISDQEKQGVISKDEATREKGGAIGAGAGSIVGSALGTAILPGVGTMIGGMLGGVVGEKLGVWIGDKFTSKNRDKMLKSMTDGLYNFFNGVIGIMFTPLKAFTTVAKFGERLVRFAGKIMNPLNWGKRSYSELWEEAGNEAESGLIGGADKVAGELQQKPLSTAKNGMSEAIAKLSAVGASAKEGYGESGSSKEAMNYFQSQGWSKEQSAGIVGNLQVESGGSLKTNAVGDNGNAYGIAQWHPDRQARFKEIMGIDIRESNFKQQLAFIDWELKNSEKNAGNELKKASTASEAAHIVDASYERSNRSARRQRVANAIALVEGKGNVTPKSGYTYKWNDDEKRQIKNWAYSVKVGKASIDGSVGVQVPAQYALDVQKQIQNDTTSTTPVSKQQNVTPPTPPPPVPQEQDRRHRGGAKPLPVAQSVTNNTTFASTSGNGALNKNIGDIINMLHKMDPDAIAMYG